MKIRKNISIIVCMFLFLSSCSQDFIDFIPTSSATIDLIYKTDKDFLDALTATYTPIRDAYQNFYIFGDLRGDDSWCEMFKNRSTTYSDQFTLNSSDGSVSTAWQRYYQAIFRVNTILSKLEDFDVTTIPRKNRYIGEARFLRALCYFDLIRIFGAVPAVTTPVGVQDAYLTPREPVENIYNNIIIPDLLAAENALLASYSGSDVGKPTIGAAKALLGKAYLTMGDFSKAESKLMELTSMNYALLDDYNALFDYSNKRHSEYIFNIEYEHGVNGGSQFTNAFLPNSVEMQLFYGITGYGDEYNNPTQVLIDLFEDHDLRKEMTVGIIGGFYDATNTFIELPVFTSQTYTKKYITPTPARNDSRADWKVIRYADVLLMLAEAMNENGQTAQAIPYLNMIRKRAGVNEYPLTISQAETRDAIMKERRLELSFEGHRWFDLVRTGKAYEVMREYGMTEYMTVFPIPLSQVQLINNPAIMPQNTGY